MVKYVIKKQLLHVRRRELFQEALREPHSNLHGAFERPRVRRYHVPRRVACALRISSLPISARAASIIFECSACELCARLIDNSFAAGSRLGIVVTSRSLASLFGALASGFRLARARAISSLRRSRLRRLA